MKFCLVLQTTYERIKVLRETGFKLIDNEHYALSSIKLNCDEIKRLCDEFEDAVNARKNMLQTNIDVLECLNQVTSIFLAHLGLLFALFSSIHYLEVCFPF